MRRLRQQIGMTLAEVTVAMFSVSIIALMASSMLESQRIAQKKAQFLSEFTQLRNELQLQLRKPTVCTQMVTAPSGINMGGTDSNIELAQLAGFLNVSTGTYDGSMGVGWQVTQLSFQRKSNFFGTDDPNEVRANGFIFLQAQLGADEREVLRGSIPLNVIVNQGTGALVGCTTKGIDETTANLTETCGNGEVLDFDPTTQTYICKTIIGP